jgi:hypothetical protein
MSVTSDASRQASHESRTQSHSLYESARMTLTIHYVWAEQRTHSAMEVSGTLSKFKGACAKQTIETRPPLVSIAI